MIIGFKPQFCQKILDWSKIHTIRADKKGRWKEGNLIDMATGVRTKEFKYFCRDRHCTGVQRIYIEPVKKAVWVDNKLLEAWEIALLAKNDGFETTAAFWQFFPITFSGKIIHWTQFRYSQKEAAR